VSTVFDSTNYRKYLNARLTGDGPRSGLKSAAAKAIGCHSTYLSQVLNDRADLSLEQADLMNAFLAHTKEESDFFILIVLKARAGTTSLRNHFQEQIDAQLSKRTLIKNRVGQKTEITAIDESKFYSSWYFGVLHVLVSIPSLQSREAIAQYLKLPLERVTECLTFLEQIQLIRRKGSMYEHNASMVHLSNDSTNIVKHHLNWRLRSMRVIEERGASDTHYSAAVSLSKRDAARIKQILVDNLQQNLEIIASSKEEVAYGLLFDFFELKE
jgi:uncharacterized protein (TIGR02147 family)